MKKFRLTIDIEVSQDEELTPEVFQRAWGRGVNIGQRLEDPDWQENKAANEAMLKALLVTDPETYKRYVFEHFEGVIANTRYERLYELAGYNAKGPNALSNLVEGLPAEPRAFFRECLEGENGLCADLVDSSIKVELKSIQVDEVEQQTS